MRLFFILLSLLLLSDCRPTDPASKFPAPTEVYAGQNEGEHKGLHKRYLEVSHRTAPGVDWRSIEATNRRAALAYKNSLRRGAASRELFAGGLIEGEWYERGAANQAGSVITHDFDPASNRVYTVSDAGTIMRGQLDGSGWTVLNDDLNFHNRILRHVVLPGGQSRLVAARGKELFFSDDEGATWTAASGLAYEHTWGGAHELVELANQELYFLVQTWLNNPWGGAYQLYHSADHGASWTLAHTFANRDYRRVAMWQPFETDQLYVLDNAADLYAAAAGSLTLVAANTTLPVGGELWLTGSTAGGPLKFYLLTQSNQLFQSTDMGLTWGQTGTLPSNPWDIGVVASPFSKNTLFYGEVDLFKTSNNGADWTIQNHWYEYYGNTHLLHADIMRVHPYRLATGEPFWLISNHGGLHVTYDNFTTTSNIGLVGLHVGQYYDHVTSYGPDSTQFLFIGTQDQGMQRMGMETDTGLVNAAQVISGDYVKMHVSDHGRRLWEQYPNGVFHYYNEPFYGGLTTEMSIEGEELVNSQLWAMASAPVADPSENAILIGGGSTTGDDGSYLIKLKYLNFPAGLVATQFPYNFRPNANNGNSYLTAVAQSTVNPDFYFTGLADGTFFYSHDGAVTWQKAANFSGPGNGWLYGSCIAPSRLESGKVFYGGSGYSSPGVFMSTDGGITFAPLSNDLPATFFNEIELNDDETLLFAATDAGPFVYVFSEEKWFSLMGVNTPLIQFKSVEYLPEHRTARFATYGRGIWDLKLAAPTVDSPVPARASVKIFPNPVAAASRLNVQTDWPEGEITLFDLQGRMLIQEKFSRNIVLNLTGLGPGMYAYRVEGSWPGQKEGGVVVIE